MQGSRSIVPSSGFSAGRVGPSRGFAPRAVGGNVMPAHPVSTRPVHLRPVPVHATPGIHVRPGSNGMVTRFTNLNRRTTPASVTPAAAVRPVNTAQPFQPISPAFTYQSAFPFFPAFADPFCYGFPCSFLGYPYDVYGAGLYANPYVFAGAYGYNPSGFAGAYGYGDAYAAANPYINPGASVSNSYATTPSHGTPSADYRDRGQHSAIAQVEVVVPDANAEVWFNGVKTVTRGEKRLFASPPLDRGANHVVAIRAVWREGGQDMTVERSINLTAGAQVRVEFSRTPVRVTAGHE